MNSVSEKDVITYLESTGVVDVVRDHEDYIMSGNYGFTVFEKETEIPIIFVEHGEFRVFVSSELKDGTKELLRDIKLYELLNDLLEN